MADLNLLGNSVPLGTAATAVDATGAIDPLANSPVFPATTANSVPTAGTNTGNFFNFAGPNNIGNAGTAGITPTVPGAVPTGVDPATGLATGATAAAGNNMFNFQPPNPGASFSAGQPAVTAGSPTMTAGGNTFNFQPFQVASFNQPRVGIGVPNANFTPAFQGAGPVSMVNGIPSNMSIGGNAMMNVGNPTSGGLVQPTGGNGQAIAGGGVPIAAADPGLATLARADGLDLAPVDSGLDEGGLGLDDGAIEL